MKQKKCAWVIAIFIFQGCSQFSYVPFDQVEPTNTVRIQLQTGRKIEGTVIKKEPYHLEIKTQADRDTLIPKVGIRSLARKPPVYDDFGNGISEEEIRMHASKRNTTIYGIGGGLLSFGISFFIGSLVGQSLDQGSRIFAMTTVGGTGLGTWLFVHAGKKKDRNEAIQAIRVHRKKIEVPVQQKDSSQKDPWELIEIERQKSEEMRKQREQLLKELEETKNQKN